MYFAPHVKCPIRFDQFQPNSECLDRFFAKVRDIKIPTEILDRCGEMGKRTDMTRLTGAFFFATTRSRDQ